MNNTPQNSGDPTIPSATPQPVAYDAEGRPLYAHPPVQSAQPVQHAQPVQQVVHVTRPLEPQKPTLSPEAQKRHDESKQMYPLLNLSAGEYVVAAVRRHPIGLILPLSLGTLLIGMALAIFFNYSEFANAFSITGAFEEVGAIALPLWGFVTVVALGMAVVYYVYIHNKFFMTNESVIQEIQHTPFSRLEQTVSLGNIEDASFTQHGILQQVFDYGDIRLSTEGDETTYRFSYVAHPKTHIAELNNAVEAFKNGRPVEG